MRFIFGQKSNYSIFKLLHPHGIIIIPCVSVEKIEIDHNSQVYSKLKIRLRSTFQSLLIVKFRVGF